MAKQVLGKHAGEPAGGGFARWMQSSQCFRLQEDHGDRVTSIQLEYVVEVRDALNHRQDGLPEYRTDGPTAAGRTGRQPQ
ncbi:hypothetical protein BRC91_09760 [Halobacteriales archaeon QS_4_62_28]|nr:MAG: hypothetical protein BRC91_09760 [Halobacteriales archaeon QS_4_62_28]